MLHTVSNTLTFFFLLGFKSFVVSNWTKDFETIIYSTVKLLKSAAAGILAEHYLSGGKYRAVLIRGRRLYSLWVFPYTFWKGMFVENSPKWSSSLSFTALKSMWCIFSFCYLNWLRNYIRQFTQPYFSKMLRRLIEGGGYFKWYIFSAAVNRGRRLIEGGAI